MSTFDTDGQDEGNGNEYLHAEVLPPRAGFEYTAADSMQISHKCPYCKKEQGTYQHFEGVILCGNCQKQYFMRTVLATLYTTYKRIV